MIGTYYFNKYNKKNLNDCINEIIKKIKIGISVKGNKYGNFDFPDLFIETTKGGNQNKKIKSITTKGGFKKMCFISKWMALSQPLYNSTLSFL